MSLERILYVDDDESLAQLGQLLLEADGFEVRTCAGGEQALAMVDEFAPQLILLDKEMPGMDGPATLAALRARPTTASTPVVFLTAESDTDAINALVEAGAAAVLPKPIEPASFAIEVRALHAMI